MNINDSKKSIDLFVPGRLCIIGEHSDWAGIYRRENHVIPPGEAIVTGIEQGIYANARKDDRFIFTNPDDTVARNIGKSENSVFTCEMDSGHLKEIALSDSFFSYVSGVASFIKDNYNTGGISVSVGRMDLPMKKGLSSSAAVCLLTARAFNILYGLKMSPEEEISAAFTGEQYASSRCGLMDYAQTSLSSPAHIIFNTDNISVSPLTVGKTLHFVYAVMSDGKNTKKILSCLNSCYPFAHSKKQSAVQQALGQDNHVFVKKAAECIRTGDAEQLGKVLNTFQNNFDEKVAPACPEELNAPYLHRVLNDRTVKSFVYGGKGIGSQGDGAVQLLAKDEVCQKNLIGYINNVLKLKAFPLTLHP